MKKIMLLYNPIAGDGNFTDKLDDIVKIHQTEGFDIIKHEVNNDLDINKLLLESVDDCSYILVAGGDGTVNTLVNALMKLKIDIPIGILPTGTANDLATHLGIPGDIIEACKQIMNSTSDKIDVGKINDDYFINVACLGLFTEVSQKTDISMKNNLGKLAYYLKGIQQIPNFKKIPIKVKSKEFNYEGDIYIILILNGNLTGNMDIAYKASVTDGKLDVILVNPESLLDVFPLILKLIMKNHLDDPVGLKYFQTDEILIETEMKDIPTDIDGEYGPELPLRISCIKKGLSVLGIVEKEEK